MRRVVPILLVLVLVPSSAAASWYTCRYDNVTRSACCCPGREDGAKQRPATPEAQLRAACCCTVTRLAGTAAMDRANASAASMSMYVPPVTVAIAVLDPAPSSWTWTPAARARAPDPPDTLYSRRCSLLL